LQEAIAAHPATEERSLDRNLDGCKRASVERLFFERDERRLPTTTWGKDWHGEASWVKLYIIYDISVEGFWEVIKVTETG
jgi:hypothetical protein